MTSKQPANTDLVSIDEYYEMIDERLNGQPEDYQWPYYPIDLVAGPEEFANFKAALTRWLAAQEREHAEAYVTE